MSDFEESLTANEIDANPSLARHEGDPLRKRNRSGQKAGVSKTHFDETYIRRKYADDGEPGLYGFEPVRP